MLPASQVKPVGWDIQFWTSVQCLLRFTKSNIKLFMKCLPGNHPVSSRFLIWIQYP